MMDYTPWTSVVFILSVFFYGKGRRLNQVMLKVHAKGESVCGVYPFDIAETESRQWYHSSWTQIEPNLNCATYKRLTDFRSEGIAMLDKET